LRGDEAGASHLARSPYNLALRPIQKSGGAEYVPTAYYAHRDTAGFAARETGNERTETI